MAHAAHVDNPVGHRPRTWSTILGYAGLVVGTVIAAAAGGVAAAASAAISATGIGLVLGIGLLIMALAGASGTVATVTDMAQRLGGSIDGTEPVEAGKIISGARSVYIGPHLRPAANASAATRVDCHTAHVSQGSVSIHTEGHNASRKGDGTTCGGVIMGGCESVDMGGATIGDQGGDAGNWLYRVLMTTQKALDDFGTAIPGGTSRKDIILWIWGLIAAATGNEEMKDAGGVAGVGKDLRDIPRPRIR